MKAEGCKMEQMSLNWETLSRTRAIWCRVTPRLLSMFLVSFSVLFLVYTAPYSHSHTCSFYLFFTVSTSCLHNLSTCFFAFVTSQFSLYAFLVLSNQTPSFNSMPVFSAWLLILRFGLWILNCWLKIINSQTQIALSAVQSSHPTAPTPVQAWLSVFVKQRWN